MNAATESGVFLQALFPLLCGNDDFFQHRAGIARRAAGLRRIAGGVVTRIVSVFARVLRTGFRRFAGGILSLGAAIRQNRNRAGTGVFVGKPRLVEQNVQGIACLHSSRHGGAAQALDRRCIDDDLQVRLFRKTEQGGRHRLPGYVEVDGDGWLLRTRGSTKNKPNQHQDADRSISYFAHIGISLVTHERAYRRRSFLRRWMHRIWECVKKNRIQGPDLRLRSRSE